MRKSLNATNFHNPLCSNSRKALGLLRACGIEPTIVEYLTTPPGHEQLGALIADMELGARALLRDKEPIYAELGLGDTRWTDADLIDAMVAHPVLINRPIVVTPWGVALCRPPERVLELLPHAVRGTAIP